MYKQTTAALTATLAAALLAAGCGSGSDSNSNSNSSSQSTTTPTQTTPADSGLSGTALTRSAAADTQVTLGRLLGEHAALAMFATQKGLDGSKDFPAIAAALDANTVDISKVIGSVYGPAAAKEFLDGKNEWRAHITNFVTYTQGLGAKDEAKQAMAVKELGMYVTTFSSFLSTATGIDQKALENDLNAHIIQLKGQIDAYAQGNYNSAYELNRGAYEHMFMTAQVLAEGIAKQQHLAGGKNSADAVALRITLGRLLGEHAILAQFAMQKGLDGKADFKQIATALDNNSQELGDAIGAVYGKDAGVAFLGDGGRWRAHIGFFVDYTKAVAAKDEAAKKQAVAQLYGYMAADSKFLSGATGLPAKAVQQNLTLHIQQLTGQIDAYAAGDFAKAYGLERAAYAHMYGISDALATAIADQGKVPKDMAQMNMSAMDMSHGG